LNIYFLEHLCEYFAKFGSVESATVKFDKSGRSKGFGFVLFEDRDATDKVKTNHRNRIYISSFLFDRFILKISM
jgi:RNA recognition motif-containing protein